MVFIRDEAETIREGTKIFFDKTKIFRDEVPVFENDKRKNGCNDSCIDCSFPADSFFPAVLLVLILVLILLQILGKEIGDEAHGDKSEGHPFVVIDVNAV